MASWKLHRSGSLSLLSASSLFEFWPWQWSKDEIVGIWPSNSCYSRDLWSSFEGNPWYIARFARHFIPLDTFWCLHSALVMTSSCIWGGLICKSQKKKRADGRNHGAIFGPLARIHIGKIARWFGWGQLSHMSFERVLGLPKVSVSREHKDNMPTTPRYYTSWLTSS